MFEASQGHVCCLRVVVLPAGCLGERVAGFCPAGFGFLHADQGRVAVALGGPVLAEVAEQDAGMCQQVAVDSDQVAGLPESLPAAAQQCLCLAVKLEHLGEDLASRCLGVFVGEDDRGLVEVLDCFIAGIARRDPGGQAGNVVRCRDR